MRIISTMDDDYYHFSGKILLDSIVKYLPAAEVIIYEDFINPNLAKEIIESFSDLNLSFIRVDKLPEFLRVFEANVDIIPEKLGGSLSDLNKLTNWNLRWSGWFRKVVMQHDAICNLQYEGYTLFVDSDIMITKTFDDKFIESHLRKSVGLFLGNRACVESSLIIVDGKRKEEAKQVYQYFLGLFTSGQFRKLKRWDDSYTITKVFNKYPNLIHDFGQGKVAISYVSKSPHGRKASGQIIPNTVWKDYIDHNKGIHWRKKVGSATFFKK